MLYIVDDDTEFSALMKEIAAPFFKELTVFNDPTLFSKCVTKEGDVIVLDIKMPKMDGIELLRVLAKNKCQSELILVSGFEGSILNSTAMLAKESGLKVSAQLTKPFKPQELIKILSSVSTNKNDHVVPITSVNTNKKTFHFTKKEIKQAIEQQQFCLHYQPQIDLKSQHLTSVEGLVRWQHPKHGMLPPIDFLNFIEQYELQELLTDKVIQMAIKSESDWNKMGFDISTSINVYASNVTSLTLPETLESLIEKARINPSKICFEVTESELMTALIPSIDTLTRMRLKGFKLSIDDFGTGFSSLLQLYRIPFNELKIDRSFVSNLLTSNESKVIVESCILLAHKLGMKVVAEGVENKETLKVLTELNCDFGQGYYFSKPLPEKDLIYWLHEYKKVMNN